jgi:hypothetical protein
MTPLESTRRNPEVVVVLLVAAGLAWWWTVERMAGMDASPGTDLGTLGWFTGTWVVMMAALVALQKISPSPRGARLVTATVPAVLAAGLLAAPHQLPDLVASDHGGMSRGSAYMPRQMGARFSRNAVMPS